MLIKKEGPIDILFNNAGVSQFGYFEESDLSVLDKIMDLDFFSVVQFTTPKICPKSSRSSKSCPKSL